MKTINKKSIIILISSALILLVIVKLYSNKKEVSEKVYTRNVNLKTVIKAETVKESDFNQSTPFLGEFAPNREVAIASETAGKVIRSAIEEGSNVSTGTLIARLDDGILQAQYASARANFSNASNKLKRYQQVPEGVTQLEMDNAKNQMLTSQAEIQRLQRQISQFTIKAPFSGIVSMKKFELGAVVSPGSPLATITDISVLKLEISVPEKQISNFRKGMNLNVTTEVYPNMTFHGKVDMVASVTDASHNYTVKILVPNNSKTPLKSGMYGNVTLENNVAQKTITIPRSALIGTALKPQVYVVKSGIAKLRAIEIGQSNANNIQVLSGLNEGEVVATAGLVNLNDGTEVTIKNN
ncbi:efflux RND transporter periplasmic adaptor subunit [Flavobacterium wongokense]|uniref:efflux RND transporter periplasmic adaptor subunit n=1 Tax=Flavobacterium wongokense TaxID=2910674 RepID=UPI001F242926|nr:efflux RND transporter periplasmic adaptor subunit [Flavobacterium sp. WG47]MCF6132527.1 efflux RND transporter periplasmic adaptor subunit [Flavobacterium sp. WG47]